MNTTDTCSRCSMSLVLHPLCNANSGSLRYCSKTHCPYCKRVKQLFTKLGASFKVVELDVEGEWTKLVFLMFRAFHLIRLFSL
jgi:sulfatase maturation enzyme AslB (radical SAM superfamily)